MATFNAGQIIKHYRVKRGLTRAKLCGEDCDESTLRHIESGTRAPSIYVAIKLFEKLGLNAWKYILCTTTEQETAFLNMYYKIETLIADEDFIEANNLMSELENIEQNVSIGKGKKFRQQMIKALKCALMPAFTDNYLFINHAVTETLLLTLKCIKPENVADSMMSYNEISLLNILASVRHTMGQPIEAIEILISVIKSMDKFYVDEYEKSRGYVQTLYNLSSIYGMEKNHLQVLNVCNEAIRCCVAHNRLSLLPHIKFNKACALYYMGDIDHAKAIATDAVYALRNNENYKDIEIRRQTAEEMFGIYV